MRAVPGEGPSWHDMGKQEASGTDGERGPQKGVVGVLGGGQGIRARKTGQPARIRCLGQGCTAESSDLPAGTARNHPENSACPKFSPLFA